MKKNPQKYLFDIVEVGTRLVSMLANVALEDYEEDIEKQKSIERKIEKIAEASYKLKNKFEIELIFADKIYIF